MELNPCEVVQHYCTPRHPASECIATSMSFFTSLCLHVQVVGVLQERVIFGFACHDRWLLEISAIRRHRHQGWDALRLS